MLEALKRIVLGDPAPRPAPADDPTGELAHVEEVIRDTEADLQEAREAVDHFRQQLAAVDARALLDRPDVDDDLEDWQEQLRCAQEDVDRLEAALPKLATQRDEATLALKRHQLTTCFNRIEHDTREYATLSRVLNAQLSAAAETAVRLVDLSARIDTDRSQATGLQVEMREAPTGISFTAVDIRALWVQMLAKARTRPAATTPAPPPIVEPPDAVTDHAPPVASSDAGDRFESEGHIWAITPTTEGTCQHPMGNKAGPCGDPGAYQATYHPPGERLRSWIFCEAHSTHWQAQHITLPSAAMAGRGS